jgi:hypothetical protein
VPAAPARLANAIRIKKEAIPTVEKTISMSFISEIVCLSVEAALFLDNFYAH